MRKYEIMYILRSDLEEQVKNQEIENISNIFKKSGSNILKCTTSSKELAYEIQKLKRGYYVSMEVEADSKTISEFNRVIRYNEKVIRYIVLKEEK